MLCAAVADYRPAHPAKEKIKREHNSTPETCSALNTSRETGEVAQSAGGVDKTLNPAPLTLPLVANPDIAAALGRAKRPDQTLVGFALETNNAEQNALGKMARKNLDMIILNTINSSPNVGEVAPLATEEYKTLFNSDTNQVTIYSNSSPNVGEVAPLATEEYKTPFGSDTNQVTIYSNSSPETGGGGCEADGGVDTLSLPTLPKRDLARRILTLLQSK
ncbi:MAG: hypothetical protein IKN59_02825 [Paludibacteraceae bacterium]|nr:hypothetical protein [Paludibacteraceae bacterium]